MKLREFGLVAFVSTLSSTMALAEICDYRLSSVTSLDGATTVAAGGSAVAGAPIAMHLAGLYFIPHSTSGAIMLGSTLPGVSAAGTIGIIGGSGFAASVLAFLTAPITLIVAGGAVATVGAVEAGCYYFVDERITSPRDVLNILIQIDRTADEKLFKLFLVGRKEATETGARTRVRIPNENGGFSFYYLENLYIVNGELMHRDWLRNTRLGSVAAGIQMD